METSISIPSQILHAQPQKPKSENKSSSSSAIRFLESGAVFLKAGRTRNTFPRKEAAKRKATGRAPKGKRKSKPRKGKEGWFLKSSSVTTAGTFGQQEQGNKVSFFPTAKAVSLNTVESRNPYVRIAKCGLNLPFFLSLNPMRVSSVVLDGDLLSIYQQLGNWLLR